RPWVENPEVGTYHLAGADDAYLCATGRAFRRPGTVNPLHVRFVEGPLPFLHCLEDLYALTTLAWTRPEGRVVGLDAPDRVLRHVPDLESRRRDMKEVSCKGLDVGFRDPGRAKVRVDVAREHVLGEDGAERLRVSRIGGACTLGGGELRPNVPRKV